MWHSGLRIQHCYSCSTGYNCSIDLILGPGTSTCRDCGKKKKKAKQQQKNHFWGHWATEIRPHWTSCHCDCLRNTELVMKLSFSAPIPFSILCFVILDKLYFCFSRWLPVRISQKETLEGDWKPGGETNTTICVLCLSTSPPQTHQLPALLLRGWSCCHIEAL